MNILLYIIRATLIFFLISYLTALPYAFYQFGKITFQATTTRGQVAETILTMIRLYFRFWSLAFRKAIPCLKWLEKKFLQHLRDYNDMKSLEWAKQSLNSQLIREWDLDETFRDTKISWNISVHNPWVAWIKPPTSEEFHAVVQRIQSTADLTLASSPYSFIGLTPIRLGQDGRYYADVRFEKKEVIQNQQQIFSLGEEIRNRSQEFDEDDGIF